MPYIKRGTINTKKEREEMDEEKTIEITENELTELIADALSCLHLLGSVIEPGRETEIRDDAV